MGQIYVYCNKEMSKKRKTFACGMKIFLFFYKIFFFDIFLSKAPSEIDFIVELRLKASFADGVGGGHAAL